MTKGKEVNKLNDKVAKLVGENEALKILNDTYRANRLPQKVTASVFHAILTSRHHLKRLTLASWNPRR